MRKVELRPSSFIPFIVIKNLLVFGRHRLGRRRERNPQIRAPDPPRHTQLRQMPAQIIILAIPTAIPPIGLALPFLIFARVPLVPPPPARLPPGAEPVSEPRQAGEPPVTVDVPVKGEAPATVEVPVKADKPGAAEAPANAATDESAPAN